MHAARRWLADYVMLVGAVVVALGWLLMSSGSAPYIILVGAGIAFLGLLADPRSRWRAGAFIGIATAWLYVGVAIVLLLAVARLVRAAHASSGRS